MIDVAALTRLLVVVFVAVAAMALAAHCAWRPVWTAYARWIETSLRPIFLFWPARRYALFHLGGATAMAVLGFVSGRPVLALLGLIAGVALGFLWPGHARRKRIARIEAQIDPTLRSMAQTLRATPNLVDALEAGVHHVGGPIAQEIDLILRQHRLGLTLDEALRHLGQRLRSRNFDAALVAIVIGRRTGGRLPEILDEIAATLRERCRLDAFVDAKTAEGKMQAAVMAAMPPLLGVAAYQLDPAFVLPLVRDPIGWALLVVIVALVCAGAYLVRRVSEVDA